MKKWHYKLNKTAPKQLFLFVGKRTKNWSFYARWLVDTKQYNKMHPYSFSPSGWKKMYRMCTEFIKMVTPANWPLCMSVSYSVILCVCVTQDLALPCHAVFGHHTYTKMCKKCNSFACCWEQLTLNRPSVGYLIQEESVCWFWLLFNSFNSISFFGYLCLTLKCKWLLKLLFISLASYITSQL